MTWNKWMCASPAPPPEVNEKRRRRLEAERRHDGSEPPREPVPARQRGARGDRSDVGDGVQRGEPREERERGERGDVGGEEEHDAPVPATPRLLGQEPSARELLQHGREQVGPRAPQCLAATAACPRGTSWRRPRSSCSHDGGGIGTSALALTLRITAGRRSRPAPSSAARLPAAAPPPSRRVAVP